MTLQEFIASRPQSYGTGNANLLYSSSVSGSDSTPIAPFHLQGLTIPFTSQEGTNVAAAFKEVTEINFTYTTGTVTAKITGRQKRSEYFYFTFDEVVVNQLPTELGGINTFENSEFVFVPYSTLEFNNNDYNPLMNNSEGSKRNAKVQKVDRFADAVNPTNFDAILSQSAEFAEIQNCSYTKTGIINGKYNGSKFTAAGSAYELNKDFLTSYVNNNSIAGNSPAQSVKGFKGSIHSSDADTNTIKNINQSDREIVRIFFNSEISGSHPAKSFPSFPNSGSYIFTEQGNDLVRTVGSKIFSIDKGEVFTTNELGGVTLVE